MMNICFYFQVHQPYRIRKYSLFDIDNNHDYFDNTKNEEIIKKVSEKCYLKTNNLLLKLLKQNPKFKITFSFSGIVLEQLEQFCPEVIHSFQQLTKTSQVDILGETYYHSLAFVYSENEFIDQLKLHEQKIEKLFNIKPEVLRNTELIYNNDLAICAKKLGYKGVVLEGSDKILGLRSSNFVYKAASCDIPLLTKNYNLSDDIAFRFSQSTWPEYPLTAQKYTKWLNETHGNGQTVNLFMDYETFGEHQWESTGIFDFLKNLPNQLLEHPNNTFSFPKEVIQNCNAIDELNVPQFTSWADQERDLSAWTGNDMQKRAIESLYKLENNIKKSNDLSLLNDWRKLQTSDHFYYMCTKKFSDGQVHEYFNPYESPYEAFIYYINVINDLEKRLNI